MPQEVGVLGPHALCLQQDFEVQDRQDPNVRGVVPVIRQVRSRRRSPLAEQGKPHGPMAEVGERHNDPPANAPHLSQQLERFLHDLQRLAENHVVEARIRVVGQALVDIALVHREPELHAAPDLVRRDFDTAALNALVLFQPCEQIALSATQIEHARALLDQVRHDLVVLSGQQVRY